MRLDYSMKDLAEACEDGRIVVLPCKPGKMVYEIDNNTNACYGCEFYVSDYTLSSYCTNPCADENKRSYPNCAEDPACEKQFLEVIGFEADEDLIYHDRDKFGKTIFLSRQEAEAAMEEMKRNA